MQAWARGSLALIVLALTLTVPTLKAQHAEDFDEYQIKIDAAWFYSKPTGDVKGGNSIDRGLNELSRPAPRESIFR
jgi:hypothetical protein